MRIAIVIGVNKPRALTALQGAVNDARAFAEWIASPEQGFEVRIFADDQGPVTFKSIFDEIERVVSAATYSQVIVYFAGHGFQRGGSEVWLLSDAPSNSSEAISVEASVMASRESGLKSVVFISDACRSIPARMQDSRVDGGSIFPNVPLKRRTRPEIDRLFATLPSLVAVEAAKADDSTRRGGIFTRELMNGYLNTPSEFVDEISENGQLIEVVTNRKLKDLLSDLVEDAAADEMAAAGQTPEFILESVQAYLGRVERKPKHLGNELNRGSPRTTDARGLVRRRTTIPSVTALAREAIRVAGQGHGAQAAAEIARKSGYGKLISDAIDRYTTKVPIDRSGKIIGAGFAVTGTEIVRATALMKVRAEARDGGQRVDLEPGFHGPGVSVLVEFKGGTGTVLPALPGYVGHIFVNGGAVTNVNYDLLSHSTRWNGATGVEALRAAVAAAAGLGVLRIDQQVAQALKEAQRVCDPSLGLYSAYAYASAGIESEVASALEYVRHCLEVELFDVAMLVRRGVQPREAFTVDSSPILPFCPMLRQGWALLALREAKLPDVVRQARDWVLPAVWTTFAPEGVKLLREAMKQGYLQ